MNALLVLGLIAAALTVASAFGYFWAPALLAVGLAGWGLLLLTSGLAGLVPILGLGFVAVATVELAAAFELYGESDARRRRDWQLGSAVVGLGASAAALASLASITSGIVSAIFI